MNIMTVAHSMEGIWSWPAEDRERTLQKLRSPNILKILTALKERGEKGLSNAEVDSLLGASSQWLVFWDLRELLALHIVEFDVQFFGEPGRYRLTESGLAVLEELRGRRQA